MTPMTTTLTTTITTRAMIMMVLVGVGGAEDGDPSIKKKKKIKVHCIETDWSIQCYSNAYAVIAHKINVTTLLSINHNNFIGITCTTGLSI